MRFRTTLIILLLVIGIKTADAQSVSKISDSDKSKIIKSILSEEFPIKDADTICISTENIPKALIEQFPKIDGMKFILAAPENIREESGCGVENYFFGKFERKGSSILVYFGRNYSDMSSAARRYSYRKVKGKWRGKIAGFFLSRT